MAPTQWLPHAILIPILYHCSSWTSSKDMMDPPRPGPSCGARRPTVEYTRKEGKTQATKWTSHDLPVWIDLWLQSISPRVLVVSVNMAAPNQRLFKHGSLHWTQWPTHRLMEAVHGPWQQLGSHGSFDGRYGGWLLLFHLWLSLVCFKKMTLLRPRPRAANCPETMFCNTRMIHTQKMPLL